MTRATLSVTVSVEVTCLLTRGLSSKRRAGRKHAFQAHSPQKSYLGEHVASYLCHRPRTRLIPFSLDVVPTTKAVAICQRHCRLGASLPSDLLYYGSCSRTCQSTLSATASEWNVHSFRIQPEPSRPVGTAAEIVERVVRFVVRSTTD